MCEIYEDARLQEEYTSIQTAMSGAHLNSRYTTDVGHMERVRIIEDDSLDTNLASVAKFDQAGCEVTFKHGWGTVTDAQGQVIIRAELKDGLYLFNMNDATPHGRALLASVAPKDSMVSWHDRLGHRNVRDIKAAVSKGLIEGINPKVIENSKISPLCDSCARSKSSRTCFHRDGEHQEQLRVPVPVILNVRKISTDINGPFETCGDNRERYIQTFMEVILNGYMCIAWSIARVH